MDVHQVNLLRGGDVERDDGCRAVMTDPNSFRVKVLLGRIDGEAGKVIKGRSQSLPLLYQFGAIQLTHNEESKEGRLLKGGSGVIRRSWAIFTRRQPILFAH